ncbi:ferritin family protein [Methanomassiliicoccus luminyensis]|uniref:ferritin family protein n=1 Tax=Methanomassiliicoccus luminyensis TaxID=1080712 RepID=UPI000367F026|nr:ferritin family protein [Methanomassiliicoccus luminyensis]
MLSKIPGDIESLEQAVLEREAIRAAIIGEFDAIDLYEQLAAQSKDPLVKKVLLDIAGEEKTHVGELTELLKRLDPEQKEEFEHGREEVEELGEE